MFVYVVMGVVVGKIREIVPEEMTPKLSFKGLTSMKQVDKVGGRQCLPGRRAFRKHGETVRLWSKNKDFA